MSKRSKDVTVVPKSVPIQRTDLSTFDDSFSFLKEKFVAEMQRMEDEMNKFSVNLSTLYGQQGSSNQPGQASGGQATWDALANSPLIQGEGNDKMLKLQFDVSTFDPSEVRIDLLENKLIVHAHHEQKTPNSEASRDFRREFFLPRGTNVNTIISSLSRDGVLTVQAPLPPLVAAPEDTKPTKDTKNVLAKGRLEKSLGKRNRASADSRTANVAEEQTAPPALTAQVPQSPLSPKSPASSALPAAGLASTEPTSPSSVPGSPTGPTGQTPLSTAPTSPTGLSPTKTSKTPSKVGRPGAK